MGKHLVFVGAGHAHLTALTHLADYLSGSHAVTVINPFAHTYYSGMGPGLLSGLYQPRQARFNVRKMAEDRGATFIEDSVSRIDPDSRTIFLHGGRSVAYDLASFNAGSEVPVELLGSSNGRVIPVKPVINLYRARTSILGEARGRNPRIVVVGGGPAGVEVSASVWRLLRDSGRSAEVTLVAGRRLLEGCPSKARLLAMSSLGERSIRVLEGKRVQSVGEENLTLSDGKSLPYDYAFMAVGVRPSVIFRSSGLRVAEDGGLPVNGFLQSVDYPELFGGGDCISLEGHHLARVGVHAVRQNPILHNNLLAALNGGAMQAYAPREDYLLILNMGNGKGILFKNNRTWSGRLPFLLKDFIDRRFMRRFQVSGELGENA